MRRRISVFTRLECWLEGGKGLRNSRIVSIAVGEFGVSLIRDCAALGMRISSSSGGGNSSVRRGGRGFDRHSLRNALDLRLRCGHWSG